MSGGRLRVDTITLNPGSTYTYTAGTIQVSGNRNITSDSVLNLFFPGEVIPAGKALIVEVSSTVSSAVPVTVDGGKLRTEGFLFVGDANGDGAVRILNGGTVECSSAFLGSMSSTSFFGATGEVVLENGSTLRAMQGIAVAQTGRGVLTIGSQSLVDVGSGSLSVGQFGEVTLQGGTLRFGSYSRHPEGEVFIQSGTVQLVGPRTIGGDAAVADLFGAAPTITLGKTLIVEHISTLTTALTINRGHFKTNSLVIGSGGALDFERGILEINGGVIQGIPQLVVPADGEFRGSSVQEIKIVGAAGSKMTATGDWAIGDSAATNGFYSNGIINTGRFYLRLQDANDAVLDSGAFVTIGDGSNTGILDAPNGLTLDFGSNVQGIGSITTPNNAAKPLINNGHITGTSASERITLPGYVKGVGTLDNVNLTGTYSPGLSPTVQYVGNLALSPTSTLLMEIGGTLPGSGYDQLQSAGALDFDGTLLLSLINGFLPTAGQSFILFDWISRNGTFDTLQLPTLAGLAWNTSQLYTAGIISLAAAGLPGDYNNNGTVDAADYTLWRNNLGSATALPNDDTPGVDQGDYTRWRTNFVAVSPGNGAGSGSGSIASLALPNNSVPEPSCGAVILILFAWLPSVRTRARFCSNSGFFVVCG